MGGPELRGVGFVTRVLGGGIESISKSESESVRLVVGGVVSVWIFVDMRDFESVSKSYSFRFLCGFSARFGGAVTVEAMRFVFLSMCCFEPEGYVL